MKVIGTELYEKGLENAIQELESGLEQSPKNRCISPSDANVLVEARRNPQFRFILHQFYWNLPDGVPSVWILKRKGAKKASRCSGPDFFERLIKSTVDKNVNHFLLGGAAGVAEALKNTCREWGNDHVTGTYSPPYVSYDQMNYAEMAAAIKAAKADIVWVGLGTPKQIYCAHELAKKTQVKYIITIGAAFDFHTGRIKKAPHWIQKIGMEWMFRLLMEPKRLFKRYFRVVPQFLWFALLDGIRGKK